MNKEKTLSALEAVLFASGEPISTDRLSKVFEIEPNEIDELLNELKKKYEKTKSGLTVLKLENTYQLATVKEHAEYIKRAFDI